MGVLQGGPGGQNFGCVGHNAFGPTNNWPVRIRKLVKLVTPDVNILRLKCTKFAFRWGFAQDPARGAYSAL